MWYLGHCYNLVMWKAKAAAKAAARAASKVAAQKLVAAKSFLMLFAVLDSELCPCVILPGYSGCSSSLSDRVPRPKTSLECLPLSLNFHSFTFLLWQDLASLKSKCIPILISFSAEAAVQLCCFRWCCEGWIRNRALNRAGRDANVPKPYRIILRSTMIKY